jgi:hypothetical protein
MTWKNFAGLMVGVSICAAPFVYYSDDSTKAYSSVLDTKVYGAMTDDSSMNGKLYAVQTLGLSATRETVLTTTYKGKSSRLQYWNDNGIKMFLNINSYPQATGYGFPNKDTFVPIMLEIAAKYKPFYIFIENEELNPTYHSGELFFNYISILSSFKNLIYFL